jgi:hypothetical protein
LLIVRLLDDGNDKGNELGSIITGPIPTLLHDEVRICFHTSSFSNDVIELGTATIGVGVGIVSVVVIVGVIVVVSVALVVIAIAVTVLFLPNFAVRDRVVNVGGVAPWSQQRSSRCKPIHTISSYPIVSSVMHQFTHFEIDYYLRVLYQTHNNILFK